MRLGLSSYTYVWAVGVPGYDAPPQPMTAAGLLQKARDLDVGVVQIADNLPLDRQVPEALDALARQARQWNIELEVGTCGIEPPHLVRYLELAAHLESKIVRTLLDNGRQQPSVDEAVANLAAVARQYERQGVWLAVENHDRFKAATLVDILRRVGSPHVGICLDTANSLSCLETPATTVEILGPWAVNLHIKDFRYRRLPHSKGFVVEGCPAGQGQLDIPWLLETLRRQGRQCNAIVELWPAPEATIDQSVAKEDAWAAESVQYLRNLIPE